MDESQSMQLRATMYRELGQYVAPKRKAVEVTGEDGSPIQGELTISAWLVMLSMARPWGRRASVTSPKLTLMSSL